MSSSISTTFADDFTYADAYLLPLPWMAARPFTSVGIGPPEGLYPMAEATERIYAAVQDGHAKVFLAVAYPVTGLYPERIEFTVTDVKYPFVSVYNGGLGTATAPTYGTVNIVGDPVTALVLPGDGAPEFYKQMFAGLEAGFTLHLEGVTGWTRDAVITSVTDHSTWWEVGLSQTGSSGSIDVGFCGFGVNDQTYWCGIDTLRVAITYNDEDSLSSVKPRIYVTGRRLIAANSFNYNEWPFPTTEGTVETFGPDSKYVITADNSTGLVTVTVNGKLEVAVNIYSELIDSSGLVTVSNFETENCRFAGFITDVPDVASITAVTPYVVFDDVKLTYGGPSPEMNENVRDRRVSFRPV